MWNQHVYVLQQQQKHKNSLGNFYIFLILKHVCEWWNPQCLNVYNITSIVTILPRGDFTKEVNNS